MAFNQTLAIKIRKRLNDVPNIEIEEKKMFGGLAFMVNGKMCINVSGENLMCRFDPSLEQEISKRAGFQKMTMKGRDYKGYCYVSPQGFKSNKEFDFWLNLCLDFNEKAKASKKKK